MSKSFLDVLHGRPADRTPVWLMRQAGRYLPEYRALRQRAGSFMRLCQTPTLACEVTLQPLRRFDLDAAIIFSDILTIPDAMGLGLEFIPEQGPVFARRIAEAGDIDRLHTPDAEKDLGYVGEAIRLFKRSEYRDKPLIGFAGSPWTLAVYMIEGGSSRDFVRVKSMLAQEPRLLHDLLCRLEQAVSAYVRMQIKAGVDAVMIFDTWGSLLMPERYEAFSLQYIRRILQTMRYRDDGDTTPTLLFALHSEPCLDMMADSGCNVLGIDHHSDLARAKRHVGDRVVLQGNFSPLLLQESAETISEEAQRILKIMGDDSPYIFNLGHGVLPQTPPEHVAALIDSIRQYDRNRR